MATETKVLCGACAALMKEAGLQLRQLPGRTEKISCEHCGKRRFGGKYEIGPSQSARGADSSPRKRGEPRNKE